MTFAERFGHNLAEWRKRLGVSQEDLGLMAGLHRTAVGQIERGERVPRTDTLVKLAGSLGNRPEDLLAGLSWQPQMMVEGALIVSDDSSETPEP